MKETKLIKRKGEQGITLIALVVTIVVLLILAGVTITFVLSDGGILQKAREAANKTNNAIANEQGDMDKLPGDIENFVGGSGKTSVDRTGINIGDYIDYEPDKGTEENPLTYPENKLGPTYTGYYNTAITQEDIKWQVLKIYDNGEIDIIGTPTGEVWFENATGYNNGVYILNDICKTLYSRKEDGIYARSVSSEDFEKAITDSGKTTRENYINTILESLEGGTTYIKSVDKTNNTVTYNKNYSWYPNLYAEENGSGINGDTIKSDGLKDYESKKENGTPVITSTEEESSQKTQAESLTVTNTYYNLLINETNYGEASKVLKCSSGTYWIASRVVENSKFWADFLLCRGNLSFTSHTMFMGCDSRGSEWGYLRPVIHLGSDVEIEVKGNPDESHHIKW